MQASDAFPNEIGVCKFDDANEKNCNIWSECLSAYISSTQHTSAIKRHARKLLPRILGGKLQYRRYRDMYGARITVSHIYTHTQHITIDVRFDEMVQRSM
jgi:hypothetical protein